MTFAPVSGHRSLENQGDSEKTMSGSKTSTIRYRDLTISVPRDPYLLDYEYEHPNDDTDNQNN